MLDFLFLKRLSPFHNIEKGKVWKNYFVIDNGDNAISVRLHQLSQLLSLPFVG